MKSALQTLSRIEKFNINEQRKKLVACQEEFDKFQHQLDNLNLCFEQEKEFYRTHEMSGDFGAYTKHYLKQKEKLENRLAELEAQMSQIRDIISDLFKQQKTFDIVDDNRRQRMRHEEELKTQKQLDEIGTNAYIKHHGELAQKSSED